MKGPSGPPHALVPNNAPELGGEIFVAQIHPPGASSATSGGGRHAQQGAYAPSGAGLHGGGHYAQQGAYAPSGAGLYAVQPGVTYVTPPQAPLAGLYVGQALQFAARDPQVQQAMRGALREGAHNVVKEVARRSLQQMVEVQTYVQENPSFLRALCFCVASALLLISGLSLLSVWNILAKPFEYLFALYDALFAAVIVLIEGKPEWFQCHALQSELFSRAAFLASQAGRAAFYLYVGTINLYKLPQNWLWKLIYLGIGGSLCFVGLLMLLDNCGCCCSRVEASSSSEDEGLSKEEGNSS